MIILVRNSTVTLVCFACAIGLAFAVSPHTMAYFTHRVPLVIEQYLTYPEYRHALNAQMADDSGFLIILGMMFVAGVWVLIPSLRRVWK